MKRIFLCLLALLLMGLTAAAAGAPEQIVVDNIVYELREDGTATLLFNLSFEKELFIPAEIEGHTVMAIAERAFSAGNDLVTLTLPDTITEIGPYAFAEAASLETITLPAGLTILPEGAFKYCQSLRHVHWPAALTAIGDQAFYRCDVLASVILPQGLVSIGDKTFYECPGLLNVTVPASVTDIADKAFQQKQIGVKYLTLTVEAGSTAYQHAADRHIRIAHPGSPLPSPDTAIYTCGVYEYCLLEDGTAQIVWFNGSEPYCEIPAELDGVTVTSIGADAFTGSSLLHSLVIPEGVTHIGIEAFQACYKLRDVTLPMSVRYIGQDAFDILTNAPYRQENVVLSFHAPDGSYAQTWAAGYTGP